MNRVKTQSKLSYAGLSRICGVHRRSFSDWSKGKSLMPEHVFTKLVQVSGIKPSFKILPERWHVKKAARLGGLKRTALGRNPGTVEGRKLGGRNSYKKFLANPNMARGTGFIIEKDIDLPKPSEELAELTGTILGDGGISRYQLTISLNRLDDLEYSKYVKACIRGLLDTDGCFYIDRHRQNGRSYLNPALNFTNRSMPLLQFFKNGLEKFNFHPTHKSKYSVFLRREKEIARYFEEIGSSNPKHINKFKAYLKNKSGEVPKWS